MESARYMKSTEAWRHLENYVNGRISVLKSDLLNCPLDKVEAVRAQIRSFESVLHEVEEMQKPIEEE